MRRSSVYDCRRVKSAKIQINCQLVTSADAQSGVDPTTEGVK